MGKENTVYISYNRESPEKTAKVVALAARLIREGVRCAIDAFETHPQEGIPRWTARHLQHTPVVLLVCSPKTPDSPPDPQQEWEAHLVYNSIYSSGSAVGRFIPVIFGAEDEPCIPLPLRGAAFYRLDTLAGYQALYRRLTDQPEVVRPPLGPQVSMEVREVLPLGFPGEESWVTVSLGRLPVTGEYCLGREEQLAWLDRAWADPDCGMVTVAAMGGVGKSALVNRWVEGLKQDNYRGAARVWAWSFYSQGSKPGRQVSADLFMDAALRAFGDRDATKGSAWERGERLAQLVRRQKTLLLLDGLEPMQEPPGPNYGFLKDQSLQALVRELAFDNPGLCVVTTRVPVADLKDKWVEVKKTAPTGDKPVWLMCLDQLEPGTGAELLKRRGVNGTDEELKEASEDFAGHALALNLLGSYLREAHGGDIRHLGEFPLLTGDVDETGHAERVMARYEFYFSGGPELEILYLLGFFDRPADPGALEALRGPAPLPDLPPGFETLSPAQWKRALTRLQTLGLISSDLTPPTSSPSLPSSPSSPSLDSHPLVREYFGRRLSESRPKAYTAGHRRLYEYYKGLPEKELPDTLRELEPLYTAVSHGCAAGDYQDALVDVYMKRILRGNDHYSWSKLGAFSSDIAALSNFFTHPFKEVVMGLTEADKSFVLGQTGLYLRDLGRLREAAQPMEAALNMRIKQKNWKEAAIQASNLSELWLCLGDVGRATALGRESVTLADRSGDKFQQLARLCDLADALHQAGAREEAEGLFRDAEARQKKRQPGYSYLYSLPGFRYCDLLLGRGRSGEVLQRVEKLFEWRLPSDSILDIALEHLSAGRAHWQESRSPGTGSAQTARQYLDRAVEGLREAGHQDDLPRGLLARAGFLRWAGETTEARRDLEEAREIAERSDMKLHLTDAHLEYCRLELKLGNKKKAKKHLDSAKQLVEETGYHRRDQELARLNQDFQD